MRNQLESGVERVDFVNNNVNTLLLQNSGVPDANVPFGVREIRWLVENASDYGYIQVGNSWVLTAP